MSKENAVETKECYVCRNEKECAEVDEKFLCKECHAEFEFVTKLEKKEELKMEKENRFFVNSSWLEERGSEVLICSKYEECFDKGTLFMTPEEAKDIAEQILKHYV